MRTRTRKSMEINSIYLVGIDLLLPPVLCEVEDDDGDDEDVAVAAAAAAAAIMLINC